MDDNILNDKRPIKLLEYPNGGGVYSVDSGLVIEAYPENGEFCEIPWFRIKRDGQVIARLPAHQVSVTYL